MLLKVSSDIKSFRSFCEKVDGKINTTTVDYAFNKIVSVRWMIEKLAESVPHEHQDSHEHYVWPKGKSNVGENSFQTALREMKEETGVSLDSIGFEMMKDVVTCEMYTLCNTKYVNTYYFCSIDEEVNAYSCDANEVLDCRWVCKEEAVQYDVDCCNVLP